DGDRISGAWAGLRGGPSEEELARSRSRPLRLGAELGARPDGLARVLLEDRAEDVRRLRGADEARGRGAGVTEAVRKGNRLLALPPPRRRPVSDSRSSGWADVSSWASSPFSRSPSFS